MPDRGFTRRAHRIVLGFLAATAAFHPALVLVAIPVTPQVTSTITVLKKHGQADRRAMATANGKTGSIAAHALQARTIQKGQGALLLLSPLNNNEPYRVRYYELDAGKSRLLGEVPFAQAKMVESICSPQAFCLQHQCNETR
jgi:hypothetical protein